MAAFVILAAVSCQKDVVIDYPHGCIYRAKLNVLDSEHPNKTYQSEVTFSLREDRFSIKNEYTGEKLYAEYEMDDHTARDDKGQLMTFSDDWKSFKYKNLTYYLEDFVPELYNRYK